MHRWVNQDSVPGSHPRRNWNVPGSNHYVYPFSARQRHHDVESVVACGHPNLQTPLGTARSTHTKRLPESSPSHAEDDRERLIADEIDAQKPVNYATGISYIEAAVPHLAQAIDSGSSLIEATINKRHSGGADQQDSLDRSAIQRTIGPWSDYNHSILAVLVSRWLSFGRMLFSPAHLQLGREGGGRLLVIDSLGDGELTYKST